MAQNQKTVASPVQMDSRKFLGALNDSSQAKVTFYESKVAEMGKAAGKNWQLASLKIKRINRDNHYSGELYIEDVDSHDYYMADCSREKGGKIVIENIRQIEIIEEQKQALFEQSCSKLIDAIEANDQKAMGSAFNKMSGQRFSGRAVPSSGLVRTKDGIVRTIKIQGNNALGEEIRPQIIAALVESLSDRVVIEGGSVVAGHFDDGEKIKLPVTKWAARKLVGKHMREAAQNAYWSPGFQARIFNTAKLIYGDKIEEAIKSISLFLNENEEFTLLNRSQTQTLIENALAANCFFNQQLCDDTTTLFYRTNLKINKDTILAEWRNIAKKVEHPVLLENVNILENTKNFEAAYDKFLELIFEAISNREVAAEALATTLEVLKDKTPRIKESNDMSSRLNELISRLKDPEFDDSAIYEAEDLIATVQEELAMNENLSDFDAMPGDELGDDEMGGDELGGVGLGGSEAPIININAPLISIGSSNVSGGEGDEDLGDEDLGDLGDEDFEDDIEDEDLGEEESLADMLGGGEEEEEEDLGLGLESKKKKKRAIKENKPFPGAAPPFGGDSDDDSDDDGDDDGDDDDVDDSGSGKPWEESADPYAIKSGELSAMNMSDYGAPILSDAGDMVQVVNLMNRLAEEHKLEGSDLTENLDDLARASIEGAGLRVPSNKIGVAVDEVVQNFLQVRNEGIVDDVVDTATSGVDALLPDDDDDDDELDEDQYKGPTRRRRYGMRRNSVTASESTEKFVTWIEEQSDGKLGQMGDVKFIYDHGGDSNIDPIILSEDGSVEIPIPSELRSDATAIATGSEEFNGFLEWLESNIEQLRPISDGENDALEEAIATIHANADGSISVEVDADVEVDEMGGMDMDMEPGMEPGMDMGPGMDDETAGMEPVDAIAADTPMPEPAADAMPDFENMDDEGPVDGEVPEGPVGDEDQPNFGGPVGDEDDEDEEDEEVAEDKDITHPQSTKYNKHTKDNKRDMPKVKMPKASSDKLDSVGPSLKKDDGSGTKPPVARKGDN